MNSPGPLVTGPIFTPADLRAAGLAAIVDCEVCAGTGVMTARSVDADPAVPPAVIPCPCCAGTGATVARKGGHQ